jgi:hypothetical protein
MRTDASGNQNLQHGDRAQRQAEGRPASVSTAHRDAKHDAHGQLAMIPIIWRRSPVSHKSSAAVNSPSGDNRNGVVKTTQPQIQHRQQQLPAATAARAASIPEATVNDLARR